MWTSKLIPNLWLTLSSQNGTTVQYRFFRCFFLNFAFMHSFMLLIVRLFSNLRCWIVRHLSFLEKKAELIYLDNRPFYNCSSILVGFFAQKKLQKDVRTVTKNLYSNYFQNGKWYWKNSKAFEFQTIKLGYPPNWGCPPKWCIPSSWGSGVVL